MDILMQVTSTPDPWVDYQTLIAIIMPVVGFAIGYFIKNNRKISDKIKESQDERISSIDQKLDGVIARLDSLNEAIIRSQEKGANLDSRSNTNTKEIDKIREEVQTMKRQIALLEQSYNKQ